MSRGPIPSKLHLLSCLPEQKIGDKVRFLGCVTSYNTETACLLLGHLYPKGTNTVVAVDVEMVIATMSSEMTRVGEWINVIGYLGDADTESSTRADAYVRALMVWSTGPLDIQQYEWAFEERLPG